MICLGTAYSWSLFTRPLIAGFHWSNTVTTWAFALAIFFLGVGAVIGGRWQDRVGPRMVTITGVMLWGIGNLLAGLGTAQLGFWWLYLTYGVIGGLGMGMGYITPVATVTKWFPDRRGFASGMVVMGFGLGAFFYNQISVTRIDGYVICGCRRKHATAYMRGARAAAIKAGTVVRPVDVLPASAQVWQRRDFGGAERVRRVGHRVHRARRLMRIAAREPAGQLYGCGRDCRRGAERPYELHAWR